MKLLVNRARQKCRSIVNKTNLALLGRRVKIPFIILSSPRSGSNLLSTLLQSHENLKVLGELFNLFVIPKHTLSFILNDPRNYLFNLYNQRYPKNIKALGFKIHYNQATPEQLKPNLYSNFYIENISDEMRMKICKLQDFIHSNYDVENISKRLTEVWSFLKDETHIKIIHLKRENKLKQYISLVEAWGSNQWVLKNGESRQKKYANEYNYSYCLNFFCKMCKWEEDFNLLFQDHEIHEIYYEKLIENIDSELAEIQNFLNVPIKPLRTKLKKQRLTPISASISNYSELKHKFVGTQWLEFFEK